MKVYLIDIDNGESYEDFHHWIKKVFTTYRGASQWLIDEGYDVYVNNWKKDAMELEFYWEDKEDDYVYGCKYARIIEMEVDEY